MIPKPKPVTKYSKDTQTLLDSMMSASGLPAREQQRLRDACKAGPSAPLRPPPGRKSVAQVSRRPGPHEDLLRGVPINPRLAAQVPGARLKTKEAIIRENGGSLDRPQYGGGPKPADRSTLVLEHQQRMEFGRVLPKPAAEGQLNSTGRRLLGGTSSSSQQPQPSSEEEQMRASIVQEIEERRQFLDAMGSMGHTEHKVQIHEQIAERLRDLKQLDELSRR